MKKGKADSNEERKTDWTNAAKEIVEQSHGVLDK